MSIRSLLVVLALSGVTGVAAAEGESTRTKLVILPIQSELPKARLEVLSDALAAAAGDLLKADVLGPAEVRELLPPLQQKQAANCDNLFCFAKLGKELKANVLLATRATSTKDKVLLSFKVVDIDSEQIVARHQEAVADDVLTYGAEVRAAVGQLRMKLPAAIQSSAPAPKPLERPVAKPEPAKAPAKAEEPAKPTPPPAADKPGWLGLGHKTLDFDTAAAVGIKDGSGSMITSVAEGGPASEAGIKVGNVVRKVDGKTIKTSEDLKAILVTKPAGTTLEFTLWSGGKETALKVTLKEPRAKGDKK